MKKILIGLAFLTSISGFAETVEYNGKSRYMFDSHNDNSSVKECKVLITSEKGGIKHATILGPVEYKGFIGDEPAYRLESSDKSIEYFVGNADAGKAEFDDFFSEREIVRKDRLIHKTEFRSFANLFTAMWATDYAGLQSTYKGRLEIKIKANKISSVQINRGYASRYSTARVAKCIDLKKNNIED